METEVTTPVEETATVVPEVPVEETPSDQDPAGPKAEETPKPEEKKEEVPPRKKNHDERRWERTLKERAEFKAKAEYLELLMQKQQQQPKAEGRPSRDKYSNDEDYVDALTDWKVNQKMEGVKQELQQHQTQSQSQAEWGSKINQARKEYADYDAVMEDAQDIPINKPVADAIQSSDLGADVAYYLAKNPDEAERINSLSPIAAAREIGRIESYVEYEKTQAKAKTPVSRAPTPIKPVRTSGSASKSLEDMTMAEYVAFRNKQLDAAKKRR